MLKQLFKNIKFAHYDDALRSVYDIFGQCDDVIASYGLSSLFDEHADLRSKQIDAIISAIYPDSLRDSLRNRLNLDKIDCKSDLAKFFSFLLTLLKVTGCSTQFQVFLVLLPVSLERPPVSVHVNLCDAFIAVEIIISRTVLNALLKTFLEY